MGLGIYIISYPDLHAKMMVFSLPSKTILDKKMASSNSLQYIVFVDHRFSKSAARELEALFPTATLEPYKRGKDVILFKASFSENIPDVDAALERQSSVFLDFAMPVDAVVDWTGGDYTSIIPALRSVLGKEGDKSFKLEVKNEDAALDLNAKSIEVLLGQQMEGLGFHPDLKAPQIMLYVVFLKDSVLVGHGGAAAKNAVLDCFREANKETEPPINRAEFKIKEAVKFFNIDLSSVKRELDIGAAPGGWTHYLSKRGIKVVAVDNGLLDYGKFDRSKKVLILAGEAEVYGLEEMLTAKGLKENVSVSTVNDLSANLDSYDIIHFKATLKPVERQDVLQRLGKFDMLTIDTNTSPSDSAKIATSLAALLNPSASLIITTKLVTMAVRNHIDSINSGLSQNYHSIQLKKLPHNRRELTAYAILQ